jgi:glycosyltransferase involved in cell wall biosynthesis
MSQNSPILLLISNAFSVSDKYGAVAKEMQQLFTEKGWRVITTSKLQNRFLRVLDMIFITLIYSRTYQVAQIDVFSGSAFRWAEITGFLLRLFRKPYILTLHGGNLPSFAEKYPDRVRRLLAHAHIVTAPSQYLREQMSVYRADILYLPNPIHLTTYTYKQREKCDANLIWLRALHQLYNPEMAVHVMAKLKDHFPDITLDMYGPDKQDGSIQRIQALIQKLNLQAQVFVRGAIPKHQVPSILAQCDIFLNTTNVDNTPVSVMEAMATGLCIVTTNVGGLPYLLQHNDTAMLVPANDVEGMVAAIRELLTNPDTAARLSAHARSAAEQFDWSVILPQWERLFREAAING